MTKDFSDQIVCNAMWTPDGTFLHSKHRHDYQSYTDKKTDETYFIDGGNDYVRYSNKVGVELCTITMKHTHKIKRGCFVWRTFGKDGEFLPEGKWVYLEDMETEHIQAILDTQQHIKGTYVEVLFKDELAWRESSNYLL